MVEANKPLMLLGGQSPLYLKRVVCMLATGQLFARPGSKPDFNKSELVMKVSRKEMNGGVGQSNFRRQPQFLYKPTMKLLRNFCIHTPLLCRTLYMYHISNYTSSYMLTFVSITLLQSQNVFCV